MKESKILRQIKQVRKAYKFREYANLGFGIDMTIKADKKLDESLIKLFQLCEEEEENQPDVDHHEAIKSEGKGPKNTMFPEAE